MWWHSLAQSFKANLFVSMGTESMYYAIVGLQAAHTGTVLAAFLLALLGCAAASGVNLGFGLMLGRAQLPENAGLVRARRVMRRYGVWLLAIPGMGLLGVLTVLMAAMGVSWRRIVLALTMEHLLRYGVTAFVTHRPEVMLALLRLFVPS